MGHMDEYTVADYLIQRATRERRNARVPASTWDAVLSYIRDPADAARLADSAEGRLLYCYAIPLYRHAADADDEGAARQLAKRGDQDEAIRILRARVDAGDEGAASQLPDLLVGHGDLDGAVHVLRALADAGRGNANRLARLLT